MASRSDTDAHTLIRAWRINDLLLLTKGVIETLTAQTKTFFTGLIALCQSNHPMALIFGVLYNHLGFHLLESVDARGRAASSNENLIRVHRSLLSEATPLDFDVIDAELHEIEAELETVQSDLDHVVTFNEHFSGMFGF